MNLKPLLLIPSLGLGLTLSASLAAAAGGSLSAEFPASGGVVLDHPVGRIGQH